MSNKSIAKGITENYHVEEGIIFLKQINHLNKKLLYNFEISKDYIQFHFCIKGSSEFLFNDGSYIFPVSSDNSILLYNPIKSLPVNLLLNKNSIVLSTLISIKKFHSFFSDDADQISFLNNENINNKFYRDKKIEPKISVILNQMLKQSNKMSMYNLYLRGKIFELLSLYFNKKKGTDNEQCPFLLDDNNIKKIKKAKDLIISKMTEPPTLQELANEVEISLNKLKNGFKQVYGTSVFTFLLNHKMEISKKLLSSRNYNVNEVALKVGYSSASHFINAFKKKFDITPKKYLMSL